MARACNYENMATAPAFTKMTRGLYMGSKRVLEESDLHTRKPLFSVYVSAAKEVRPPYSPQGKFETVWIKMDDIPWRFRQDPETVAGLVRTTNTLAKYVKAGHRVVVFCHMGMNRSGLITALILMNLGWPLDKALAKIRGRHQCALSNGSFLKALQHIENEYF
jgi:protein-tyrosine phosphatase